MGFMDNYWDRSAGLKNFIAPIPPLMYPPAPTPAPTPAPVAIDQQNPTQKAMSIATEAYKPGYIDQQEQAAVAPAPAMKQPQPSFMGSLGRGLASALIPGAHDYFFDQDRQKTIGALQNFASQSSDPVVGQFAAAAKADPDNADRYMGAISSYVAQNESPMAKLQLEAAHLSLDDTKSAMEKKKALAAYYQSLLDSSHGAPAAPVAAPLPAISAPPASSGVVGATINNPLNIRDNPANDWQGKTGAVSGFVQFAHPEDSFRAGSKILNSYAARGVATLDDLVKTYAPASDGNDPESYAQFISQTTGIPRNSSIDLTDPATQKRILGAMQVMEVRKENSLPQDVVDRGVGMAQGGTKPDSALAAYDAMLTPQQDMALHMAAIDPAYGPSALASFSMKDAGNDTAEIKNYEYSKLHPDFATTKTLNGQMSSFPDTSAFAVARDSGVTGEQLINTVPDKNVQNIARQLLRGDAPFFTITSRTPAAQRAAMELAQAADATYSATSYPARKKNNDYFQPSGEGGKLLSSIKAIGGHVVTLQNKYKDLDNGSFVPWNYLVNKTSTMWDNKTHTAMNSVNEAINNIAPEMAKVIAGKTDVPLAEVEAQREPFSRYDGPDAFQGPINTAAEMVAKRGEIMLDNWRSVMNDDSKPPAGALDAETIKTFKSLGVDLTKYFDTGAKGADTAPPLDALQAAAAAVRAKRGR